MRSFISIMLFVLLCCFAGCNSSSRTIQVSLPQAPMAEDTATAVLYYQPTLKENPLTEFEILINGDLVGNLIAEEPWQLELKPGMNIIEGRLLGTSSTALEVNLKAGSISYFRVRKEYGTFMDRVLVEPSASSSGYVMISHR